MLYLPSKINDCIFCLPLIKWDWLLNKNNNNKKAKAKRKKGKPFCIIEFLKMWYLTEYFHLPKINEFIM